MGRSRRDIVDRATRRRKPGATSTGTAARLATIATFSVLLVLAACSDGTADPSDVATTSTLGVTDTPAPSWEPPGPAGEGEPRELPPVPPDWPGVVELGMSNGLGEIGTMLDTAPFGLRYQYLAGGVNTGDGWAEWTPDGSFVTNYAAESTREGVISVFSYYMLFHSEPGVNMGEPAGVYANLANDATMAAYFADLAMLFQRTDQADGVTVLHLEPDLWAYMQHQATGDDAGTVTVSVSSSGMADVSDFPDTAAGFAQAVVHMRDRYAPEILLGFHLSPWATGDDFRYADPSDGTVAELGDRAAAFYESLGAPFDLTFTDIADRDAGFKEHVDGDDGRSWFDADDYRRSTVFIDAFVRRAGIRAVLWQIPLGNTRMRAMDNTWNHYQDNKVEWLLDDPDRTQLRAYVDAGVVAFLFGRGADGATCACDGNQDGITNPDPINGNTLPSLSADDDGGFFRDRAAAHYRQGAPPLP
jgi:hypothetical protein